LIERNIYYKLEIKIFNLPFAWPTDEPIKSKKIPLEVIKNDQLSSIVDEHSIAQKWKQILENNRKIPINNKYKLSNTIVNINIEDTAPSYIK
jgi:hypothetical protein